MKILTASDNGLPEGTRLINTSKLPENWIKHCVELPESGMGYQKVILKTNKDGVSRTVSGIVLNCSILETVEPINVENIVEIVLG